MSEAPWKEENRLVPNNRHLESEMECENVTRSREHLDVFANQKHINGSPANPKAWRITRLLQQPHSSLAIPIPSQMLVS